MRRTLRFLASLSLAMMAGISQAAPSVGPKHVYIVYPGQDTVWGSYLFVVNNDSPTPENFSFPVMLPKETIDFQAQDTLSPQELKLGTDGGIRIEKVFSPGETLLQVSFKLPADQGRATANFTAPYPFESFGVFVWQDTLEVNGPAGLDIQKGVNLSGRMFDTYSTGAGEQGKTITYTFDRVPEGRGRLWIIGWIVAAIIFIAGISIAFYTRPKLNLNEDIP